MLINQDKPLKEVDYFERPTFPASLCYMCGDIDCDVVFPAKEGDTSCPKCGNTNTTPLLGMLGSHVTFLQRLKGQEGEVQTEIALS